MEPTYHFSCQFLADMVAMNHADFIITSTYQEIAGGWGPSWDCVLSPFKAGLHGASLRVGRPARVGRVAWGVCVPWRGEKMSHLHLPGDRGRVLGNGGAVLAWCFFLKSPARRAALVSSLSSCTHPPSFTYPPGNDTLVGQYESMKAFTMPGLFRVVEVR